MVILLQKISIYIDPYGHIEAQLPSFTQDDLITYVQGRVGQTPYQKYGNYLIIIFSFVMVGLVLVMRRYFKE